MAIGKGTAGTYRCPKCGYGRDQYGVRFYDGEINGCQKCGSKILEFECIDFVNGIYWVQRDCSTGELIERQRAEE